MLKSSAAAAVHEDVQDSDYVCTISFLCGFCKIPNSFLSSLAQLKVLHVHFRT